MTTSAAEAGEAGEAGESLVVREGTDEVRETLDVVDAGHDVASVTGDRPPREAVADRRGRPRRFDLGAQRGDLLARQQRRVVTRVARDRETPALDGVGEDDTRPIGHLVALPVGVEQRLDVVAAEIGDERPELVVVDVGDERLDVGGRVGEELLAQRAAGQPEQRLVLLVGHEVDPPLQAVAAGTRIGGSEPAAVLHLDDVPAGRLELPAPLGDPHAGHDPVERLAVEVDEPHDVA